METTGSRSHALKRKYIDAVVTVWEIGDNTPLFSPFSLWCAPRERGESVSPQCYLKRGGEILRDAQGGLLPSPHHNA
jgi:hypothetical protein